MSKTLIAAVALAAAAPASAGLSAKLDSVDKVCLLPEQTQRFTAVLTAEAAGREPKSQEFELAGKADMDRFNEKLLARMRTLFGEKAVLAGEEHSELKGEDGSRYREWDEKALDCGAYVLARVALGGGGHSARYEVRGRAFEADDLALKPMSPSLSIRLKVKKKPGKAGKEEALIRQALVGQVENFDVGGVMAENKKQLIGLKALAGFAKGETDLKGLAKAAAEPDEFPWSHGRYGSDFSSARADFRRFGEGLRERFLRRLDESIDKFEAEVREAL